jgi:acetylornithine deacetylase/succinyl-diaminopimelate desuccinylase-like protein
VPTDEVDDRIRRAQAAIDRDRLTEICRALVDTPSPTGDEGPLADVIADMLSAAGAAGRVQPLDERQANAWGRIGATGSGDGATLMLYAPIDTMTTGDPRHDLPHAAAEMEAHLLPRATVADGRIVGLGAMNPKGHAACILAAVESIAASGVELDGDLIAAFGAGGMPTNARFDDDGVVRRRHIGQGVGCSFLIEQGVWADAAVIAKSGWAISWEEVGLAWCDITVRGTHTYVGARHLLPYRNPIADAATAVQFLEGWFEQRAERYAADHPDSYVEPQGIVGAISGGWHRMPAFTAASSTIRVDMRVAPDQTPLDARRELGSALARLVADTPGLDLDLELVLGIPGSRTDPHHWIVPTAIAAWEAEAGTAHVAARSTSGATDANILRNRGIPTVRVGLPKSLDADGSSIGFGPGMNTVDIDALVTLTRYLVRLAIRATTSGKAP